MIRILRFRLSDLKKMDFVSLFESVVSIAEANEPDKLHAGFTFGLLKEGLSLAGELSVPETKSLLTPKLNVLEAECNVVVKSIKLRINSYLLVGDAAHDAAMRRLESIFMRNLKNFAGLTIASKSVRVNFFLTEVKEDASLTDAIEAIGLTALLERLKLTQLDVEATRSARRLELSKRPKADTWHHKQQMYGLMCNFFNAIEAAQLEHPDQEYSNLVNELNEEIGAAKTKIAAKRSRNINRKKQATGLMLSAC